MPCYTPPPTEEETRAYYYKEFKHNSPLAEWLCLAFKELPYNMEAIMPDEAILWFVAHRIRDAEKERKENE
jgi:hypothetical protein